MRVFIIYFPQFDFIESLPLLSFLKLMVLHLGVIPKKALNVIELLLEKESTNSKHNIPGL